LQWKRLRFKLSLRGEVVDVTVAPDEVVLTVSDREAIEIPAVVGGRALTLASSGEYRVPLARD
jgi:trehalose/maltose hydrolase-like predicted phosphorylase